MQCSPCLFAQDAAIPRGGQAENHPGFTAADQPYDCQRCIRWHAEKFQFPELLPANETAWWMFWRFQGQQRAGGFDVLGLDYTILPFAFRLYRIPPDEQRLMFEKIDVMNREAMRHHDIKRKEEARVRETQAMEARGIHRVM